MTHEESTNSAERRTQILDAALKVFSSKGFHKATNKDIADAAGGISPGLIYWYFKDKQDLFVSLVRERAQVLQLIDHPEEIMELPPREALRRIGSIYLAAFSAPRNAALFRIILSEISRFPQMGEMLYKMLISRLFNLINSYLAHQVELGMLRPHDTAIATRSFIGMFIVHVVARELFHQPEALATSDAAILDTVIELFVRGLEPESSEFRVQSSE